MLLAPLLATLGALTDILDDGIEQHFPAAAWGWVKLGCLVADGMLGGDAAWLLSDIFHGAGRFLKGPYQQHVTCTGYGTSDIGHLGSPTHQGLDLWALLPQQCLQEKLVGGEGVILVMDGVSSGLYRPVLAQTGLGVELERHQRAHSANCVAVMA
jgi:hypothetical protein